jgi:hypothetical protein
MFKERAREAALDRWVSERQSATLGLVPRQRSMKTGEKNQVLARLAMQIGGNGK